MSAASHLRPARSTDAGQTGDILWASGLDTPLRPDLFSAAEAIGVCGRMIDRGWVVVAEDAEGRIIGFLARDGDEVHALYVAREAAGQGVGKALLDQAKAGADRLHLRAYQANRSACRFYRREGFHEIARDAGGQNDCDQPNIHFLWQREGAK